MRTIIICTAAMSLAGFNFRVLVPSLAADVFNASALVFGALYASFGIGATLGALFVAGRGRASWRAFSLGAAGLGLSALGIARHRRHPRRDRPAVRRRRQLHYLGGERSVLAPARFARPAARPGGEHLHLRVCGLMPVSAVAEGWLADRLGTRFAFAFAGFAGLLAAGYAFRRLRAIYSGSGGPLAEPKTVQVQA